jgi:uncharacterized RDD family membrane protein YckC
MSDDLVVVQQFPRVPMDRRIAAFAIDFGVASLVSLLLGGRLYIPVYFIFWFLLRVILVARNQGQSLGRWAMDIKVINPKFRMIPGLLNLSKREAITGIGSLLMLTGVVTLSPTNGWILISPLPLLADCGFAFSDPEYRRAFHDCIAQTILTQTRRGYSLDIKVKKLFADVRHRMR